MIVYVDTSVVVPLVVVEPTSEQAASLWASADELFSVPLLYVEARAALARARRLDRLPASALRAAVRALGDLYEQLDLIDVTDELVASAGELAERHALRGYDAVHLAAGVLIADADVVFATGDHALREAARVAGLVTADLR